MYKTKPYFMKNKDWYYYDPNNGERGIKLTDKAPPKAVKSYEAFYKKEIHTDENCREWIDD